jgi:hypothetical protein
VRELVDLLIPRVSDLKPAMVRWGQVTATATAPNSLSVKLDGSSTATPGLRYLASYTPTVGDTVVAVQNGPDVLVLGKLA